MKLEQLVAKHNSGAIPKKDVYFSASSNYIILVKQVLVTSIINCEVI